MKGPDEVPGVVLPVPGDDAAGGHHPVAHPLQTVEDLPGRDAELHNFLLVVVILRLVWDLLWEESGLEMLNY